MKYIRAKHFLYELNKILKIKHKVYGKSKRTYGNLLILLFNKVHYNLVYTFKI